MNPIQEEVKMVAKRPSGFNYFVNHCIHDLKMRYPGSIIEKEVVSEMCTEAWKRVDDKTKACFHQLADLYGESGVELNPLPGGPSEKVTKKVIGADRKPPGVRKINKKTVVTLVKSKDSEAGKWEKAPVASSSGMSASTSSSKVMASTWFPVVDELNPPPPQPRSASKVPVAGVKPLKRVKKAKAKGPKEGPKRPLSSFMHYCMDERPKVYASNPKLRMGEASQVLSMMWKGLDEERKNKYVKISVEDRERYKLEATAYKQSKEMSAAAASLQSPILNLENCVGGVGVINGNEKDPDIDRGVGLM